MLFYKYFWYFSGENLGQVKKVDDDVANLMKI